MYEMQTHTYCYYTDEQNLKAIMKYNGRTIRVFHMIKNEEMPPLVTT